MTKFIYALIDPRTRECRYIGQTRRPSERLSAHINGRTADTKAAWIAALKAENVRPEMLILEEVPHAQGRVAEKFWIGYMRFVGCDLTNATDVGDGHQHSPATRLKFRAAWQDPFKRKARIANVKAAHARPEFKAQKSTQSVESWKKTRDKRIAALKASWAAADERRARTSEHSKKRWQDPSTAAQLRKGLQAFHADPVCKEKHRVSSVETFNTPEVRANRSRITKELWADPEHRAKVTAALNAPEVKQKQSKMAKERQTPEMRKRISEAFTEEKRAQISANRKAYWAQWREERGLPEK